MLESIEMALEELRPGLSSDGFDLRLDSVDPDGTVNVVLEATPDACLDCLLPDEIITEMVEMAVRPRFPELKRVVLTKENF